MDCLILPALLVMRQIIWETKLSIVEVSNRLFELIIV